MIPVLKKSRYPSYPYISGSLLGHCENRSNLFYSPSIHPVLINMISSAQKAVLIVMSYLRLRNKAQNIHMLYKSKLRPSCLLAYSVTIQQHPFGRSFCHLQFTSPTYIYMVNTNVRILKVKCFFLLTVYEYC